MCTLSHESIDGIDQTSTDTSLGLGKGDKILVTFISFSRSHRHFETQILIEKKLVCTLYLEPMAEILPTITDTSLGHRKAVIRFWCPSPHFQCHYIIKTLKMSLVCTLSHESIDGI